MVGKRILAAVAILGATFLVLFLYLPGMRPQPGTAPATSVSSIGGPFTLTDANGNTVTEAALKGHYSLIYFGYTYCPDVCPLALQNITQALEAAGSPAQSVLPVFITVDPARDTAEALKAYMTHFSPRFVALTGTADQVKEAEQAYRVYAAKSETKKGDDYLMDHTGYIYLMDPKGQFVANFQKDATAADIAARLEKELKGA